MWKLNWKDQDHAITEHFFSNLHLCRTNVLIVGIVCTLLVFQFSLRMRGSL